MKNRFFLLVVLLLAGVLGTIPALKAAGTKTLYQTNFSGVAVGEMPDNFLILDGAFTVCESGGEKYLELPGAPLEAFGVMFGPTFNPKTDPGVAVSARIQGSAKGRRFPSFGVGLCGVGGFRVQITPGKKQIELFKGENVVAGKPFEWRSDSWTRVRCQVSKEGERWKIYGKAWPDADPEPAGWILSHEETQDPVAGRASVWGTPYSGTPIRFDDVAVSGVTP